MKTFIIEYILDEIFSRQATEITTTKAKAIKNFTEYANERFGENAVRITDVIEKR